MNDDYFKGLKYLFSEAKRLYPNIGYQKLTRSLDERIAEVRKREEIVKASQK